MFEFLPEAGCWSLSFTLIIFFGNIFKGSMYFLFSTALKIDSNIMVMVLS